MVLTPYASAGIRVTAAKHPTFVLWCSYLHLAGHLHSFSANTGRTIIRFYPIGAIHEGLCKLTQLPYHVRSSRSLFTFALYVRSLRSLFTFALYVRSSPSLSSTKVIVFLKTSLSSATMAVRPIAHPLGPFLGHASASLSWL